MGPTLIFIILASVAATSAFEKGIDVSNVNGLVDWDKVSKAGITFAAAKMTEGATIKDDHFVKNWEDMKHNNIKRAAYHHLIGHLESTCEETNIHTVLKNVGFDKDTDILVVDVWKEKNEEVTPDKMADNLHTLLTELEKHYKHLYIYTTPDYWENKVNWRKHDFSKYDLWIRHYTTEDHPTIPTTWKDKGYTWWQYTDKGTVDGVQGHVDLNRSK